MSGGAAQLLSADGVTLAYADGRPVVEEASIRVGPGDAVGIVGESGSGKTTLAKALVGELTPVRGTIRVRSRAWSEVRRKDPERRAVQMVFQDPYSALNPRLTPRATVAEALRVSLGVSRAEAPERAAELLADVGLGKASIDRRVVNLSGGQRQRVVVSRALACEPEVLVADEPTSSLDVSVQAQILNLLAELRRDRALALVLVTHDLSVLKHMTDTVSVMYRGRVVEQGPTETILAAPAHPYTASLVAASTRVALDREAAVRRPGADRGCVFAGRCPVATEACDLEHPETTGSEVHSWACYHPYGAGRDRAPTPTQRRAG